MKTGERPVRGRGAGPADSDSFIPSDPAVPDMVDTTVALVIIAVTLVALALITYGAIRFVPAALEVEEPEEDNDSAAG
jgi:hypothetical protein